MPRTPCTNPDVALIERAFDLKRQELGVRTEFPPQALAEADQAAARDASQAEGYADRTAIPFVTVDPPGSRDLDQALALERTASGFRLWYAIADVGFWVKRGGALEAEAWLRGVTFYAPDQRDPVYPKALSEGAASLLPDVVKPSVLFSFELDERAEIRTVSVERARVRSRAQLTYQQVLEHVNGGGKLFAGKEWANSLMALRDFGEQRRLREAERGGVSLPVLAQHVERAAAARLGYQLEYEQPSPSEDWNAQVSLLTGHAAALKMLGAGIGLLRVLPPTEDEHVQTFRRVARTLGFKWPGEMTYAEFIRSIDPTHPNVAALVWQAKRVMHGADYAAFDGAPPPDPVHHAVAMEYAHCTAPLRRLADRYVLDLLVEIDAGRSPSAELRDALPRVAKVMNESETRGSKLERAVVDIAEAWTLCGHVGERFKATVLGVKGGWVEVQIEQPPVRSSAERAGHTGWLELGAQIEVTLKSADVEAGKTVFALDGDGQSASSDAAPGAEAKPPVEGGKQAP